MRTLVIWLLLFILLIVEGSMMPWILPDYFFGRLSPHLMLVVIILYGLLGHRYIAMTLGLTFGLIHDLLYYSHMLGVFTFAMSLIGYLAGLYPNKSYLGYPKAMLLTTAYLLFFDVIVQTLYALFRITQEPVAWTLLHKIIPSVIFNGLFALAIYVPFRFIMNKIVLHSVDEESS